VALAFGPPSACGISGPRPNGLSSDHSAPCDSSFHLLLLHSTGAEQLLRPLPLRVRELCHRQDKNWIYFADYTTSWHLQKVAPKLLQFDSRQLTLCQVCTHQFEVQRFWNAMHRINGTLGRASVALSIKYPPPDEPDCAFFGLLNLEAFEGQAHVTAESLRLVARATAPPARALQILRIHVAQAIRSRQKHLRAAEMQQWVHGLRFCLVRFRERRTLCVELWHEAHGAILRQMPVQWLRSGRMPPIELSSVRAALQLLFDAQCDDLGYGVQQIWAEGGKLFFDHLGGSDRGQGLQAVLFSDERKHLLKSGIAERDFALRRQLMAQERCSGRWTEDGSFEAATTAEIVRPMAPAFTSSCLPQLLPQEVRASLYRQFLEEALIDLSF